MLDLIQYDIAGFLALISIGTLDHLSIQTSISYFREMNSLWISLETI